MTQSDHRTNPAHSYRTVIGPVLLLAALMVGGCMRVGPDYRPIEPAAPASWQAPLQGGLDPAPTDPATLARWWDGLNDPLLSDLEARAVAGNRELKQAQARIRAARAQRGISRAGLFPTLDVDAVARKARSSASSGNGTTQELYATGFDAGWEIDLFGGQRRTLEAASADLDATREARHAVLVSLLAEVALNYIELRTFQGRLTALEANTAALQESYEINLSRQQAGLISELSVQESLRILESARANIPSLEAGLEASKNRLAVLLGEPPGSLHPELAARRPVPELPTSVAVGIPAETLRHRPDVRQAERQLAAQTARIGVATAELYPKLSLSGTLGLESISAGDLFQAGSKAWSFGPSAGWRLFNAGAIRQNIEVENARQEEALLRYEATVLNAHEEVENSLIAYAKEQLRHAAIVRAAAAAERAELLARDQYQAGLVSFNNVLDAQRSLLLLRDDLAQSSGTVTANLVRLYKALGGGWTPTAPD